MKKIVNLFYRGLRLCDGTNVNVSKEMLCRECHIAPLDIRREMHLLLFMHKQTCKEHLLKKHAVMTRLHQAPVFNAYKPNNEKAKQNVLYRGAISWNALQSSNRNLNFKDFKNKLKLDQFR